MNKIREYLIWRLDHKFVEERFIQLMKEVPSEQLDLLHDIQEKFKHWYIDDRDINEINKQDQIKEIDKFLRLQLLK